MRKKSDNYINMNSKINDEFYDYNASNEMNIFHDKLSELSHASNVEENIDENNINNVDCQNKNTKYENFKYECKSNVNEKVNENTKSNNDALYKKLKKMVNNNNSCDCGEVSIKVDDNKKIHKKGRISKISRKSKNSLKSNENDKECSLIITTNNCTVDKHNTESKENYKKLINDFLNLNEKISILEYSYQQLSNEKDLLLMENKRLAEVKFKNIKILKNDSFNIKHDNKVQSVSNSINSANIEFNSRNNNNSANFNFETINANEELQTQKILSNIIEKLSQERIIQKVKNPNEKLTLNKLISLIKENSYKDTTIVNMNSFTVKGNERETMKDEKYNTNCDTLGSLNISEISKDFRNIHMQINSSENKKKHINKLKDLKKIYDNDIVIPIKNESKNDENEGEREIEYNPQLLKNHLLNKMVSHNQNDVKEFMNKVTRRNKSKSQSTNKLNTEELTNYNLSNTDSKNCYLYSLSSNFSKFRSKSIFSFKLKNNENLFHNDDKIKIVYDANDISNQNNNSLTYSKKRCYSNSIKQNDCDNFNSNNMNIINAMNNSNLKNSSKHRIMKDLHYSIDDRISNNDHQSYITSPIITEISNNLKNHSHDYRKQDKTITSSKTDNINKIENLMLGSWNNKIRNNSISDCSPLKKRSPSQSPNSSIYEKIDNKNTRFKTISNMSVRNSTIDLNKEKNRDLFADILNSKNIIVKKEDFTKRVNKLYSKLGSNLEDKMEFLNDFTNYHNSLLNAKIFDKEKKNIKNKNFDGKVESKTIEIKDLAKNITKELNKELKNKEIMESFINMKTSARNNISRSKDNLSIISNLSNAKNMNTNMNMSTNYNYNTIVDYNVDNENLNDEMFVNKAKKVKRQSLIETQIKKEMIKQEKITNLKHSIFKEINQNRISRDFDNEINKNKFNDNYYKSTIISEKINLKNRNLDLKRLDQVKCLKSLNDKVNTLEKKSFEVMQKNNLGNVKKSRSKSKCNSFSISKSIERKKENLRNTIGNKTVKSILNSESTQSSCCLTKKSHYKWCDKGNCTCFKLSCQHFKNYHFS